MNAKTEISLRALATRGAPAWLAFLAPLLDRLLRLNAVDQVYRQLYGLAPFEFVERGLEVLGIKVQSTPENIRECIPASGPLLIISNHPFGGVEMLALAKVLKSARTDIKFMANIGLQVFEELQPLFVATNPLKVSQKNLLSIRQSEAHLRAGGVLVIFPAGRVSFCPRGSDRIRDGDWNRIVGHLAKRTGAALLPVFFRGNNSVLFQKLGKLWDRTKILMLPRELLRLKGQTIHFDVGHPITADIWHQLEVGSLTRYARLMTYLHEAQVPRAALVATEMAPLAALNDPAVIEAELATLPAAQKLLDYKHFSVYYAQGPQIPRMMEDIARERERVFRLYDEGSGEPRDGDGFDQTYVQLFVWDNASHSLVGAYRLGKTDQLRRQGAKAVYLTQMFEFDDEFYTNMPPALELGRSFVVPEHQKSFHSLYLLWQGIGRFLVAHPQYRRLYGTVSLSRQYDDRAVALMCDVLIEPLAHVNPRHALPQLKHPEWLSFRKAQEEIDLRTLSSLVRGLDHEGKDVPVLLKHYYKIGAKFHCVAVDPNFNDTPGLLLMVDMEKTSDKTRSTFLGKDAAAYLAFKPEANN